MADGFIGLQIGLAIALLVATAIAGVLPLVLLTVMKKKGKDQASAGWLSYLSCFSGGVFMATCFLDVMPHIYENFTNFSELYSIETSFPITQFVICCGFFLVYFIEEFTALIFGGHGHDHSHHVAPASKDDKPNITNKDDVKQAFVDHHRHVHGKVAADDGTSIDLIKAERALSLHSLVIEETSTWVVSEEKGNLLKSLTFAIAMSFHSLLEGFALGIQDTKTGILALFFSLLLHKSIEAFSVGLQISRANSSKYKTVIATILIYSLMTPIGSILGTVLQSATAPSYEKDGAMLVLECLAAGTFIYVTFIEVLAHEKDNDFNNFKQLLSIAIGFLLITLLQLIFGHEHGGHEGHEGHHHSHENLGNFTV
ncbi:unnamed protein product [Caenorhabditis auriculariae]|uniref:Uncharacterized protein n=1 Tax=Caenorhabditis auriculariae TaxID=2777116 RepID=A0A8S1HT80_9PELO|nr:unnamed protein product [Caenorhabditis auriculariae]